ncbi:LlaJI family restriction endonuclease [Alkalibacterium olivapovliticus]|uniref:LlaJI restriction endonuclease n=1 Tax=Alkalibacterium olivapovliticus TaxID=99907 RepID=A0A2T0VSX8_9LACT|nr:LlaJI family restriction endonuclease [Alkalibacterium olivapovliticus]PRY73878.1 LlaJI restriction endonuclease [Alkalibacterium olivapovliticus]
MTSNIVYYVDGNTYRNIPTVLEKYFKENANGYSLRNVGYVINNDKIYVFLPKNTDVGAINKKDIKNLLRLLMNYDKKSRHLSNTDSGNQAYISSDNVFYIIDWLVNDFINNGLYQKQAYLIKIQDRGKIKWNKTIKSVTPALINTEHILTQFIRQKKINDNDLLSLIHSNLMEYISLNSGAFLWGFKYHNQLLSIKFSDLLNESTYRYLLDKLKSTNNKREKELIRNIMTYLRFEEKISTDVAITTEDFYLLFEDIVNKIYMHNEYLKKYVPKAIWNFTVNDNIFNNIYNNQIPDTLQYIDNEVNIYDAKYYNLEKYSEINSKVKTPPLDWYSVGKQFFYDISFKYNDTNRIRGSNNFVFPYTLSNNLKEYIGEITVDLPLINENTKINILLVDIFKILERYNIY